MKVPHLAGPTLTNHCFPHSEPKHIDEGNQTTPPPEQEENSAPTEQMEVVAPSPPQIQVPEFVNVRYTFEYVDLWKSSREWGTPIISVLPSPVSYGAIVEDVRKILG